MAAIIIKEFPDIALETVARDSLVPERGTLDISKAKNLLKYKPDNPLEIGYLKYINWYRNIFKEKKVLNKTTKQFITQLNE